MVFLKPFSTARSSAVNQESDARYAYHAKNN
nr:MAG TPA: hypothetical protein [Caudoviricetes sp.]